VRSGISVVAVGFNPL